MPGPAWCLCRSHAPSALGAHTCRIDPVSKLANSPSANTPDACSTPPIDPCIAFVRSHSLSTWVSNPASHRSSATQPWNAPRTASSRSTRPWSRYLIRPERDARTTRCATPASASASAETMPRPPRPPVTSNELCVSPSHDSDESRRPGATFTTALPTARPLCR